ncbi:hypothetical protein SUGI_0467670 [Cryptomeria japonica]|nr:hypothetical protein SUGI_0467670 [Cryptomeria japonica]
MNGGCVLSEFARDWKAKEHEGFLDGLTLEAQHLIEWVAAFATCLTSARPQPGSSARSAQPRRSVAWKHSEGRSLHVGARKVQHPPRP